MCLDFEHLFVVSVRCKRSMEQLLGMTGRICGDQREHGIHGLLIAATDAPGPYCDRFIAWLRASSAHEWTLIVVEFP
jgi:hypothetical protein